MNRELPSFLIDAGELLQHVSRVVYRGSPLYYGRSRTNRYDDPTRAYGVLYLGRDLPTALMESVFHKPQTSVACGQETLDRAERSPEPDGARRRRGG